MHAKIILVQGYKQTTRLVHSTKPSCLLSRGSSVNMLLLKWHLQLQVGEAVFKEFVLEHSRNA